MKFSLLALAIGVSAETPIPVCYGVDPTRNENDSLKEYLGKPPTADACIKACDA